MDLPIAPPSLRDHISVSMSSAFGEEYKDLHCSDCGNIVCQYNNDHIRSITFSGHPQLDQPSKAIQCSGTLLLQGKVAPYELLYLLIQNIFEMDDIDKVRALVADLARDKSKNQQKCKALYFLS